MALQIAPRLEEAVVCKMRSLVFAATVLCFAILYSHCRDLNLKPAQLVSDAQEDRASTDMNVPSESCVPAVYNSDGVDVGCVVACGYNFSTLDTKNLGTPFSNSSSSQPSNPTPGAPAGNYVPSAPANSTTGSAPVVVPEPAPGNSASDNASSPTPTPSNSTGHPSGGGVRGALRSIKQSLRNNLQNNLRQMQGSGVGAGAASGVGFSSGPNSSPSPTSGGDINGLPHLYTPAPDGYGQPEVVPTVMPGYGGHPQIMPQGYGVSVHGGPRNGELGPDMDQDVMDRHYQEMKRRDAAGGMLNPVQSDIMKNSSPAMR